VLPSSIKMPRKTKKAWKKRMIRNTERMYPEFHYLMTFRWDAGRGWTVWFLN
jgi:hypothetical protein